MSDLSNVIRDIKPCDNSEPYIFISYSSADRELVWEDVLEFQRRGYNIWLDEKNLDKTKDSWKEDALAAIEDMDCELLVFYVSVSSLSSDACYQELSKTTAESTKALHFGPVKFIAIDAEEVGNIAQFHQQVFEKIRGSELDKEERKKRALALNGFMKNFFNSNNEKVRIHPKSEKNRKMDYYEEILAAFPDVTKIWPEELDEKEERITEKPKVMETAEMAGGSEKSEEVREPEKTEESERPEEVREPEKAEESERPEEVREPEKAEELERPEEVRESERLEEIREPKEANEIEMEVGVKESEEARGPEKMEEPERAEETSEAKGAETAEELKIQASPESDYFTYYEEPPKRWAEGDKYFTKKDIKEAQQGSGIYRLVPGYTEFAIHLFGSVFGGREDVVRMTLPDTIREFNIGEFKNCINLREIRMPKYLTEIKSESFKGCSSLKCMEVPGNVRNIGSRAFQGCSSLERLRLPKGLEKIDTSAFERCFSLEELHLPETLTELEFQAFKGCASLLEVVIPKNVKVVSASAFSECSALKRVVLSEGVEVIESAFEKCGSELEIWIPDSVKSISSIAFYKTTVVFHCNKDSYAYQYAQEKRIPCIL